jgi:hypothetical protein
MYDLIRRLGRRSFAALAATALALVWTSAALAAGDHGQPRDRLAFMDSRHAPAAQDVLNARSAKLLSDTPAATAALKDSLGAEGFVKLDPLTATASFVGKTNGYLTGPSSGAASDIALGYVKANAAALGLGADGIAALTLRRDYVDILGTHHLSYLQRVNGIDVFGNGVKVNVAKDGRIINVTGSPVASLSAAPATTPGISAAQAILAAKQNVGADAAPAASTTGGDLTTHFSSGDVTQLVYFKTLDGLALAYKTLLVDDGYLTVVDAASGKVLYRDSFTDSANGLAWDNRPGTVAGGTQRSYDVNGPGGSWRFGAFNALIGTDAGLSSNNTWVYSDVNASNGASLSELIRADATGNFNYVFTPFTNTTNSPCSAAYPCSWNSHYPDGAFSWQTNRQQNGTQVYFFVNTFHDHLLAAPIGFTEAAGNFQLTNSTGQGEDGDPVLAEADDGANTQRIGGALTGMPDGNHIDNANFNTPPDGFAPRTQMYLFNWPFAPDPFRQVNGGDEGSVVYHEYGHGLSNRLVVDAGGNSTLGNIQAGSMGEAWSDWYAEDFLVAQGFVTDAPGVADILEGDYVSGGDDLIRTEPLDCKVGSSDPACDGDPRGTAGTGGYTYGDFGKIIGRPEVHADGEIWSQTLWDLRNALGSNTTEGIVTRAMELAPSNPSYLDMRNSTLQADLVANGGANHDTIWSTFAHRGMGYFAGAVDGDDAFPVENTALPPTDRTFGKLLGKVIDADTNLPIVGAVVLFGGHASGFPDDIAGITNEDGVYNIKKILVGTYPKVWATAPGYDRQVLASVTITASAIRIDWRLRRNWASLAGGGSIAAFTGPNYGPQCPPEGAIDDSAGVGWGSDTDVNASSTGNVTPKYIIVKLPQAVNITQMFVDPSNTCGDPGSSSTRGYRIQTSTDGVTFTTVNQGVFYSGNRNRLNDVGALSGGPVNGVTHIKFWMLNPQVPNAASGSCDNGATCGTDPDDNTNVAAHCGPGKDNGFGGCTFMDMVELKVYGRPA